MIIKDGVTIVGRTDNKQNELVAGDNITMQQDPNTGKTIISAGGGDTQFIWKSTNTNLNIDMNVEVNPIIVVIKNGGCNVTKSYQIGTIDENLYKKFCWFKPNDDYINVLLFSGTTLIKDLLRYPGQKIKNYKNIFENTDNEVYIVYQDPETTLKMTIIKNGNMPTIYIDFEIELTNVGVPDGEYNLTIQSFTGLRFYHF